jgi:ribonuclease E
MQTALDYEGAAAAPVAPPQPHFEVPAAPLPEPPRAAEPIRIEPYVLPASDMQAVAQAAGLEWVGSDADKVRAVQAAMAAEPLVLVETRKDLSQVRLPFETGSAAG